MKIRDKEESRMKKNKGTVLIVFNKYIVLLNGKQVFFP